MTGSAPVAAASGVGSPRSRLNAAVRWTGLSQGIRAASQLASAVILARFLTSADFGLMAMAVVVTGFIAVFRDMGIGAEIIRRSDDELTQEHASTQFWLALSIGVVAALICLVLAPVAAVLYREPRVTPIVAVLAIPFVITAAGVIHQAQLERRLRFRAVASIDLVAACLGIAVALAMAMGGFGVWSLVGQVLTASLLTTAGFWLASGWRPSLGARRASIRASLGFGAPLTGFSAVNYLARNADYALIGRVVGEAELGFYTVAYRLMFFPQQIITSSVNRVLYPALAASTTPEARGRLYLAAMGGSVFLALPVCVMIGVTAERLVPVLLGPGWEAAIPMLQLLSIAGAVQVGTSGVATIYLAAGRTDLLFRWGILSAVVTVALFVVGVQRGALGVAASYAVAMCLLFVPCFAFAFPIIGLRVRDALATIARPLVGALIAGVAALSARHRSGRRVEHRSAHVPDSLSAARRLPRDQPARKSAQLVSALGVLRPASIAP